MASIRSLAGKAFDLALDFENLIERNEENTYEKLYGNVNSVRTNNSFIHGLSCSL
jgi:hypothetical protein